MLTILRSKLRQTCKVCKGASLFWAVTHEGLCRSCERKIVADLQIRTEAINQGIAAIKYELDPSSKIATIDSIIENASILAQFEEFGFGYDISPSVLVTEYSLLKEQITKDQFTEALATAPESSRPLARKKQQTRSTRPGREAKAKKESTLINFENDVSADRGSPERRSGETAKPALPGQDMASGESITSATVPKWPNIQEWLQILQFYGIDKKDFQNMQLQLADHRGPEPRVQEVVWELLNSLLKKHLSCKQKDFRLLQMVYYYLALLAQQTQQPHLELLVESKRMLLMRYQQRGCVNKVQVITVGKPDCQICQKYDRQILPLQQAIELMPAPCLSCPCQPDSTGMLPITCTYVVSHNPPND